MGLRALAGRALIGRRGEAVAVLGRLRISSAIGPAAAVQLGPLFELLSLAALWHRACRLLRAVAGRDDAADGGGGCGGGTAAIWYFGRFGERFAGALVARYWQRETVMAISRGVPETVTTGMCTSTGCAIALQSGRAVSLFLSFKVVERNAIVGYELTKGAEMGAQAESKNSDQLGEQSALRNRLW